MLSSRRCKKKGSQYHVSRGARERKYDQRLLRRFVSYWKRNPQLTESQAIALFSEMEREKTRLAQERRNNKEKEKAERSRERNNKSKPIVRGKGKVDRDSRKGSSIRTVSGGKVSPR